MTVDDIKNGMSDYLLSEGKADYIGLIEGVGLVGDIASAIIGLLIAVIMILIPIIVAVEVCYINFPIFQDSYERIYNRLKGKAANMLGLVIRDARTAVEVSRTTEAGSSPNWVYLKIKCKSIFICFFIIAMVLGPGQFLLKQAYIFAQNIIKGFI